ncbi:antitoxin VapB family protein [Candidatus Woesearchaeota archaeon]|nr:antitoxin VapB family protein [Candidatus Woesearchaeota archaeon]
MATKTITVTVEAYKALAAMKQKNESFSQTILRVGKRRPLSDFFGILSKDEGEELKRNVELARRNRISSRKKRIEKITRALQGRR